MIAPWGFSVVQEWARGESPNAILVAIFEGPEAEARANDFADRDATRLMADGHNVYRITSAAEYNGDEDESDWDVDVLVEPIQPDMVNPS